MTRSQLSLPGSSNGTTRLPATVKGERVTREEGVLAQAALMVFNQRAGTRFSGGGWYSQIIDRLREHPDLTPERLERVVEVALAQKWWGTKRPQPNFVFSARPFEIALNEPQEQVDKRARYDAGLK